MILISLIKFFIIIIPVLLSVAILTLAERKIMAAIQARRGPNVIGYGILQPLADGLKLFIKELIIPLKANKYLFLIAPILFLSLSFSLWSVIPFETHVVASPNLAILVFLTFSSLSVYGILLGGWASNSRYAFLGALRSASQMISYELVLGLLILLVCIHANTFNFIDIVNSQRSVWFIFPLIAYFPLFITAILAETNRTPFDLPEAEAELVAGYSVEFSSAPFAFYFIAEYCNLIVWSHIIVILFFGGWLPFSLLGYLPCIFSFSLKSFGILFIFCWIRASFPRYRWDQLMTLAWRIYLPIVLSANLFLIGVQTLLLVTNHPEMVVIPELSPQNPDDFSQMQQIPLPTNDSLLSEELPICDDICGFFGKGDALLEGLNKVRIVKIIVGDV